MNRRKICLPRYATGVPRVNDKGKKEVQAKPKWSESKINNKCAQMNAITESSEMKERKQKISTK